MRKIKQRPIIVTAVAAIALGALCLGPLLLGKSCPEAASGNPVAFAGYNLLACEFLGGLARNFVVDLLFAHLFVCLGIFGWQAVLPFAVRVSIGLQAIALLCEITHDQLPWLLFVLRAGGTVVKTFLS